MKHRKLISTLFWWVSLPLIASSAAWCFFKGISALDNLFFVTACTTALPRVMLMAEDLDNNTIEKLVEEFKAMGATEFLNYLEEFRKMPLGKARALYKKAYCQEYFSRYGKNIFHKIP